MKSAVLIVGLAFLLMPALGQEFDQIGPKLPPKPAADLHAATGPASLRDESAATPARHPSDHDTSNPRLIPELRGLIFVSSPREVREKGIDGITGVEAPDVPLLRSHEFKQIVARYLGRPLDLNGLNQLVRDVVLYFKLRDRPLVDVSVPEQDVSGGDIQIVAVESRLGAVRVEGNRWFSTSLLAGAIRLHPGDLISGKTVAADAGWVNANPFRQVDLVYTPGRQPGTTDIVLKTQDRFPLRAYVGYEDTGNQFTGFNRWLAGFNWGNAFGLDQQVNYQFTMNDQYHLYNAHSGSWIIPLPWRHTLTFFGSYSQSQPDSGSAFFAQNGYSWQVSGRYTVPLPGTAAFHEEAVGGFDFKRSNSNLFFGGAQVFQTDTDVDQFMAGYNASLTDPYGSTSLNASFFYGPGGLSEYDRDADYSASQPGAHSRYYYGLVQLNRVTRLPCDFSLATKFVGQIANSTLIGSEQFGIGGDSTVRGYDERVVNGDSGAIVSNELRTPPLSLGEWLAGAHLGDQLQFLAFVDYGAVSNNKVDTGDSSSSYLVGVGPGIRYLYNPYLSVRCDYGYQLKDDEVPGITGKSRLELGAVLSY